MLTYDKYFKKMYYMNIIVYLQYVLNVTPDLPNTFESEGGGINYLKIPIADHWSQNLAVHFPQAIRFIGNTRTSNSARRGLSVCRNVT